MNADAPNDAENLQPLISWLRGQAEILLSNPGTRDLEFNRTTAGGCVLQAERLERVIARLAELEQIEQRARDKAGDPEIRVAVTARYILGGQA